MESSTRVQILDAALYVSLRANIFGKVMNTSVLPAAMGRIVGQIDLFCLGLASGLGEKIWIQA